MSKINELELKFDASRMIDDLITEFLSVLDSLSDELAGQMKTRATDPDVVNTIKKYIYFTGLTEVVSLVGSEHWRAFLDNYGTGSLMASESENPFLSEYKENYFHDFRPTNAVTKREAGSTYEIPNWETGDGYTTRTIEESPIPPGTNLETLNWNEYHYKFRPKKPSFFLETSMRFIEKRFEDELMQVYQRFPFEKYLTGGI